MTTRDLNLACLYQDIRRIDFILQRKRHHQAVDLFWEKGCAVDRCKSIIPACDLADKNAIHDMIIIKFALVKLSQIINDAQWACVNAGDVFPFTFSISS